MLMFDPLALNWIFKSGAIVVFSQHLLDLVVNCLDNIYTYMSTNVLCGIFFQEIASILIAFDEHERWQQQTVRVRYVAHL